MEFTTLLEMGEHAGRPTGTAPFSVTLDSREPDATEALAGPAWVLDGLSLRWSAPGWPAQPEPVVAAFRLLSADPDGLPPLEVGTLVHALVLGYPEADVPSGDWAAGVAVHVGSFFGRISDAVARPVMFRGQAMVEVQVTAVDHSAEWQEIYIGAQPWPEESGANRLERIVAAAGLEEAFDSGGSGMYAAATFRGLDVDHRSFADLMEEHLAQVTDLSFLGEDVPWWTRGVTVPQVQADGTVGVLVDELGQRGGTGARVLVEVDGILTTMAKDTMPAMYTEVLGPVTGVASVPASLVSVDLEWRRDKGALPSRVAVGGEFDTRPGFGGGPSVTQVTAEHPSVVAARGPVTLRLDSTLKYIDNAESMAGMYLPDKADYAGRWAVERVGIYGGAIRTYDAAMALLEEPFLFPWHGPADVFTVSPYPFGSALHVHGLQAGHRLAGDYVAGVMIGAALEVRASERHPGRRLAIGVELAPLVRRPTEGLEDPLVDYAPLPATPSTLARHHPTITPADVDPSLTPYDLRLVRNEEGAL